MTGVKFTNNHLIYLPLYKNCKWENLYCPHVKLTGKALKSSNFSHDPKYTRWYIF